MTLTRHARALAAAHQEAQEIAQRAVYRERLLTLQHAFEPPLTPAELSAALGLVTPREGEKGSSEAARFLSDSPRWRRTRPDGFTRAVIDKILAGELLIAARRPLPGARREMLVGEPRDVQVLGSGWQIRNLAGGPVPELRREATGDFWNDGEAWDLFERKAEPNPPRPPLTRLEPRASFLETRTFLGRPWPRLGLGTMRLSTGVGPDGQDLRPDRATAIALIHAALDTGLTLIDTADAYAWPGEPAGHNELLVREALDCWQGPAEAVLVMTKVGFVRQGSRYVPHGHPDHLKEACEQSLRRLRLERLELLAWHGPDPRIPLADSLGALVELEQQGKIKAIGLCNIQIGQLEAACAMARIAAVQVAFSYFEVSPLRQGLWQRCVELGIPLLAHSPLGGWRGVGRVAREANLLALAGETGLSPHQVALAWLGSLDGVIPLVGATRRVSWQASHAALATSLPSAALQRLDTVVAGRGKGELDPRRWRAETARRATSSAATRGEIGAGPPAAELVLFVGPPAAGKTSRVEPFLTAGYCRLNRDLLGGSLDDLLPRLRQELKQGQRLFVLDNTYGTRESRRKVLEIARSHNLPTRVLWLDVSLEDSLFNACLRMIERHGHVLEPDELKRLSRTEPNMLPPAAIYRYFELFEAPIPSEGFTTIERIPFERHWPAGERRRALIVDIDGTIRGTTTGAPFPRDPAEVVLLPRRREVLERWRDAGYLLLAVSNQAHVGLGQVSEEIALACFSRTRELLGLDLEIRYCPHAPRNSGVWTRKPMPGLGVELIESHRLDPSRCHFVGDQEVDRQFATNCFFQFHPAEVFFGGEGAFPEP